jgi:hypothetical protein
MSLASRSYQKFAFRFFGTYKVLQSVDAAAYKLELPAHAQIHNVVHVSKLKKHVPPDASVRSDEKLRQLHPSTMAWGQAFT